jgi:spore germination protein
MCPFAYLIREDGSLQPLDDTPAIRAAYAERIVPYEHHEFTVHQQGREPGPCRLENAEIAETVLDNAIAVMRGKGYLALNVDFETCCLKTARITIGFYRGCGAAASYGLYRIFRPGSQISAEQRASCMKRTIIPPWRDARLCHQRPTMGLARCPAQAISPLGSIRQVLDYAVTVIRGEKSCWAFKSMPGIGCSRTGRGREPRPSRGGGKASGRALRRVRPVRRLDTVPVFCLQGRPGRAQEVWLEDARSAQANSIWSKSMDSGISYWALGYPFPQTGPAEGKFQHKQIHLVSARSKSS